MNKAADDSQGRNDVSMFETALSKHGWKLGDNLQIDYRWGAGDTNLYRKFSDELVALAPNLLLGIGGTAVGALQRVTRDVPIVFVETTDPVNRGLVASLPRPGPTASSAQGAMGERRSVNEMISPSTSEMAPPLLTKAPSR
jgi:putative ABC transport system substrate-binding protein